VLVPVNENQFMLDLMHRLKIASNSGLAQHTRHD